MSITACFVTGNCWPLKESIGKSSIVFCKDCISERGHLVIKMCVFVLISLRVKVDFLLTVWMENGIRYKHAQTVRLP